MTSTDIIQMNGAAFASWLRENREMYDLGCERLGRYLGVDTGTVEGYEKGYFCRQVYREALVRFFEDMERTHPQRKKAKAEVQTAEPVPAQETELFPVSELNAEPDSASEREKLEQSAFGAWLKDRRKALGMKQDDFARAIGISSRCCISQMERGMWKVSSHRRRGIRERVERLLKGGADNALPAADGASDMRESAALHTEEAAAYDPEPASETVSGPLPAEEPQEEPRPFDGCQEVINRLTGRQGILLEKGLIRLSNDAFFRLCCYMKDLLSNKDNLDARFAGVDD